LPPNINISHLNSQFATIGIPFIELIEVSSTNNYAIDAIQANLAVHGTTYFAHTQTAGRGQRGKTWLTEPCNNIILSSIIDTSFLILQQQFSFSVAIALGCSDFFAAYAGQETAVKWPNDIYWRDRKAAGLLIENIIRGHNWPWSVVGIGININQTTFDPSLKNPVSLKQITGKTFDTILLAKELCIFLDIRFQELLAGKQALQLEIYNSRLFGLNKKVTLKKDATRIECTIKGVNQFGELLVEGIPQTSFVFGEVEWILENKG